MKKYLAFIFITFLITILSGCNLFKEMFEVKVDKYSESITLSYDEDIASYLPYESVPTYKITFDGSLNVAQIKLGRFEAVLTQNDDFKVSIIIRDILNEYKNRGSMYYSDITVSTQDSNETWMNRRDNSTDEKVYLKVKDGKIYNKIAYITLDNGLQLTINYATFTDTDNITYYRWEETQNIRIILQYPMMITKINDEKKILFLALPNGVHIKFDTVTKKLDRLINDDKFLDSEWYTFDYPNNYEEDYQRIYDYYVINYNGQMINGDFVFTYLGYDFIIEFTNENFIITRK